MPKQRMPSPNGLFIYGRAYQINSKHGGGFRGKAFNKANGARVRGPRRATMAEAQHDAKVAVCTLATALNGTVA